MALTVKVVVLVLGVGFGSCLAQCQSYKNTQYILVPVVAQFLLFFFFFKLGSLPAIDLAQVCIIRVMSPGPPS